MLYWICPECGHECSPAIRECPTCAAAEKAGSSASEQQRAPESAEKASTEILTLAQNFESEASQGLASGLSTGLLSTSSYRNLVAGANRHPAALSAAVIDDEPTVELPPFHPEDEPAAANESHSNESKSTESKLRANHVDTHIDSFVKPLVDSAQPAVPQASTELAPLDVLQMEPSRPENAEMKAPPVSPVSPRAAAPSLIAAEFPRAEFELNAAALTSTGQPVFKASSGWAPKAQEQEIEPVPSRRKTVAFLRPLLHPASQSQLALGDLAGHEVRFTAAPAGEGRAAGREQNAAPLFPVARGLAFTTSQIDLSSESLAEILRALERSAEDLEESAIRAIQGSFGKPPALALLAAPFEIVTAPAPPIEQWLRSPKLVFAPQRLANAGLATFSAGPQTPTLAGPCLPPQLRNFTGKTLSPELVSKRTSAPTWIISVLVAMALFVGGGSVLQYLSANRDAHAASVSSTSQQASDTTSASAVPVAQEHPGARFVEVAGLRVVTAANKHLQLQYVVINHSSGELTGLNIHITVHSPKSPAGEPLFSVSTIIPSLAPDQSKEIRTDLDAGLRASALPNWQSLRPEISITRE